MVSKKPLGLIFQGLFYFGEGLFWLFPSSSIDGNNQVKENQST